MRACLDRRSLLQSDALKNLIGSTKYTLLDTYAFDLACMKATQPRIRRNVNILRSQTPTLPSCDNHPSTFFHPSGPADHAWGLLNAQHQLVHLLALCVRISDFRFNPSHSQLLPLPGHRQLHLLGDTLIHRRGCADNFDQCQ